ncbi:hypothetical protein K492DRAFT_174831 [Lichtheimia hyalospora FSU 10163]|nr:hypothetical protein K492DRAFT_174831 [Lichtheimia hyalospora FSU 10163]
MSRTPDSVNEAHKPLRLARQTSHDVLRPRQQMRLPAPMSASKSTRITPSRSRMSDSSFDDETSSPTSVPRFSISSNSSVQTVLTTPRSSITTSPSSPKENANHGNHSTWIGQRVTVETMNISGTLRFLGTTQFKAGVWAGIELDDTGTGKNDGSVAGVRYFVCPPKTGIFVLSSKVQRIIKGARASRYVGMTAAHLKQQSLKKQVSSPCLNQSTSTTTLTAPIMKRRQLSSSPLHPLAPVSPNDSSLSSVHPHYPVGPAKKETDPEEQHHHSNNLTTTTTETETSHIQCENEIHQLQDQLSTSDKRINELEESIDELKRAGMETIELYERAVQRHDQDMKRYTAKLAGAHARIQALETERDRLTNVRDTMIADHKRGLAEVQERLQQTLEQKTNDETKWKADLEQQLATTQSALEQERVTQQCAERECDRLREKIKEMEDDKMGLMQELERARTVAKEEQQLQSVKLQHLESENRQLNQALQQALRQRGFINHSNVAINNNNTMRVNKELPPTPHGPSQEELQAQLADAHKIIDRMNRERADLDRHHRREINTLNRDITELESLIEAKIFKEADLLGALDHERKAVRRLLDQHTRKATITPRTKTNAPLRPPPSVPLPIIAATHSEHGEKLYCDVCQVEGHDLMGCPSLLEKLPSSIQSSCRQVRADNEVF